MKGRDFPAFGTYLSPTLLDFKLHRTLNLVRSVHDAE